MLRGHWRLRLLLHARLRCTLRAGLLRRRFSRLRRASTAFRAAALRGLRPTLLAHLLRHHVSV